jgi:hypothetical protein
MRTLSESTVEQTALSWLESVGWAVKRGPDISPDGLFAERADYREVALAQRLRDAWTRPCTVLGDEALRTIAQELLQVVRNSATVDWTVRENARAQLRVLVKRVLRKHRYPPDRQDQAAQRVLKQAEALSQLWAETM